jgi:Domain of unknown function (DUF4476)/Beta/Gamma crystallin
MKKIKNCLVAFLIPVTFLAASGQAKVKVYTHDFNGVETELGIGKYDYMTLVRSGISVVRSIRIPSGLQVTLFEKASFEGTSLVLTQDANLKLLSGKGFGNVTQNVSIIVEKAPEPVTNTPAVTFFKDNFSGPTLNLGPGHYDHYELGNVDNDHLSSVKVPKGMKVTLYEHGGYKGRSIVITQDASADFLIKNKFNDITSSIFIELLPESVVETPVVKDSVKEKPVAPTVPLPTVVTEEKNDPASPMAIFYEGNFSGLSKKLGPGRYTAAMLGMGDNAISSVKVPEGLRVTLFDQPKFNGKSLVLKGEDASASYLDDFNNRISSIVIELVPRIIIYEDNFTGEAYGIEPGYYYNISDLSIGNDELSSVRILPEVWVLLFEHSNFSGRSLLLTQDASEDFMSGKEFNNQVSSMIVGTSDTPLPEVTLYNGDREEAFKKLTPGEYPLLEDGNNILSSIDIPRGLKVTLYENAGYEGRSMEITKSVGTDFLKQYEFDNLTSSVIIEQRNPRELTVTIYSGSFKGFSQELTPGRYYARDLTIGTKDLTSLKVPRGMEVTLFANNDFTGVTYYVQQDTDFTGSAMFDNLYSSLIVKDRHQPVVTPVTVAPAPPVEDPKPAVEVVEPVIVYDIEPSCTMNDAQYQLALKSIESKPFSKEKMEMVMLVTKDKCLTNDQIRGIAGQFGFEEQTLQFVKYAYDLAREKDTYYLLEDVFKFTSSKDAFRKFLKEK